MVRARAEGGLSDCKRALFLAPPPRLRLLDLRRIKQRRDDRGRADADGIARLDQFGPPLVVACSSLSSLIIVSVSCCASLYSRLRSLGSADALARAVGHVASLQTPSRARRRPARAPRTPRRTPRCRPRRGPARPRCSPRACSACCSGGVDPGAILCLTFTKAGAAEMANRIAARLAAWVRMPDVALRHDLFALGEAHDPARAATRPPLVRARARNPRRACASRPSTASPRPCSPAFPPRPGSAPGFQPIEGRAEAELIRRTLATLLADAEASGDDALIADVQALSLRLGEGGAQEYLTTCARGRGDDRRARRSARGSRPRCSARSASTRPTPTTRSPRRLADDEIDVPTIERTDRGQSRSGAPRRAGPSSPI